MRLLICALSVLLLCLAGFVPLTERSRAHAQQPVASVLVIDGGTLIDGNGAAPVRDVQIVVEGNRIRSIGRKGQNRPADAQVLNADGKFILPGLWDGLVNYLWYQGEVLLNNGITSYIGIGDMGEVGVVYAEGIKRGKIRAPRPFDWPVHFQWPAGNLTGLESPYDSPHPIANAEEARAWTKRVLDLGGYAISFQNGGMSPETFKVAVDVAHAAGKPVGIRPGGNIGIREAALMGADFVPRSQGAAAAVTSMPAAAAPGGFGGPNELEQWAQMDDAKAADLIKILVQHKTTLIPAFTQKAPGLPTGWSRFELQARRLFADPFLMAYYPASRAQVILWNYLDPPDLRPDVVEVRRRGYKNALRFHRMFVEAGGHLLTGTDGGNFSLPGLAVHHEMQLFSEDMGLPRMQIIQAATKWAAETMRVHDQIGTVEVGKLADLLIVNDDPLQEHPFAKEFLFQFSRQHPDVLKEFRTSMERLERADRASDVDDPQFDATVAQALTAVLPVIRAGRDAAGQYHAFMVGALEFLLYPHLGFPQKEREINEGRKRIDIVMENCARSGPFYDLPNVRQLPCPYILIECKNYRTDIANPELDQLAGRMGVNRGMFGLMCCRRFEDRATFIARCRDSFTALRQLIVPLDDATILEMLEFVRRGERNRVTARLGQLIAEVWV